MVFAHTAPREVRAAWCHGANTSVLALCVTLLLASAPGYAQEPTSEPGLEASGLANQRVEALLEQAFAALETAQPAAAAQLVEDALQIVDKGEEDDGIDPVAANLQARVHVAHARTLLADTARPDRQVAAAMALSQAAALDPQVVAGLTGEETRLLRNASAMAGTHDELASAAQDASSPRSTSALLAELRRDAHQVHTLDSERLAEVAELTEVDGTLSVQASDLETVELTKLRHIRGRLVIVGNPALTRVSLPALETLEGGLEVEGNPALAALELGALRRVQGSASVVANPACTTIEATHLGKVDGDLTINENATLASARLPRLVSVGGSLRFEGNGLVAALDLASLEMVANIVSLAGNRRLAEVQLAGLTTIGNDLLLSENPSLVRFEAKSLSRVGGAVTVSDNPALASCALDGLKEVVGTLEVSGNHSLTKLPVGKLTWVQGNVIVVDNLKLVALELGQLQQVNGDLAIAMNDVLADVGIDRLEAIGGALSIVDNASLTGCGLRSLQTSRAVEISNNGLAPRTVEGLLERLGAAR